MANAALERSAKWSYSDTIVFWLGQVMTMWTAVARLRSALPLMTVLALLLAMTFQARAAEPTAAGLWQKIENGKPELYVLMVDHGGIFEGVMAKTFPANA
jgi:hypothetical protein